MCSVISTINVNELQHLQQQSHRIYYYWCFDEHFGAQAKLTGDPDSTFLRAPAGRCSIDSGGVIKQAIAYSALIPTNYQHWRLSINERVACDLIRSSVHKTLK